MKPYKSIFKESSIAKTILQQLGGNKFIAMTGAKNLVDTGKGLKFKIGGGAKKGISYVNITLNSMDTYDVQFMNRNARLVSEFEDVYADNLQELFTSETGFYTSLGSMGR